MSEPYVYIVFDAGSQDVSARRHCEKEGKTSTRHSTIHDWWKLHVIPFDYPGVYTFHLLLCAPLGLRGNKRRQYRTAVISAKSLWPNVFVVFAVSVENMSRLRPCCNYGVICFSNSWLTWIGIVWYRIRTDTGRIVSNRISYFCIGRYIAAGSAAVNWLHYTGDQRAVATCHPLRANAIDRPRFIVNLAWQWNRFHLSRTPKKCVQNVNN